MHAVFRDGVFKICFEDLFNGIISKLSVRCFVELSRIDFVCFVYSWSISHICTDIHQVNKETMTMNWVRLDG